MTPYKDAAGLLRYCAGYARKESVALVIVGFIQILLTLLLAYSVANILQYTVFTEPMQLPPITDGWMMAGALLGKPVMAYLQSLVGQSASVRARRALREHLLMVVGQRNIGLLERVRASELTPLVSTQVDALRDYFADFVPQRYLAVLMPIAVLIASATVSWLVALILLLTAPLVPLFMVLVGRKAAQANRDNLHELNRLGNLLADRLRHLETLQRAGTQAQEARVLFRQSERFRSSTMKVLKLAFLSGTLLEFFSAISVALVAVYLGLFYLGKYEIGLWANSLTLHEGVFLLMLAPEFYLPLRRLGVLYHAKAEAMSVAEAICHITQLASYDIDPPVQAFPIFTSLRLTDMVLGSQRFSITLRAGDVLLLTGPSGSGKTTLLDRLAGLQPLEQGHVSLNDGDTITVYRQPHWYRQLGYMTQQPELLHCSIRENLTLGRTFTDEQLMAALELAQVADVVAELPHGLDYPVAEIGGYLSGGQAQRVAVARVFLHRPSLLILDEPTASLDQETAQRFFDVLNTYCEQGGCIIIATHRDPVPLRVSSHVDAIQGVIK